MVGIKTYIKREQAAGRSLRAIGEELGLSHTMLYLLVRDMRNMSIKRLSEVCSTCEHVGLQESVDEMLAQQATGVQQ
jgi:hypothetical protein